VLRGATYRLIGPSTVSSAWNPGFGPDWHNRQYHICIGLEKLTSNPHTADAPRTRLDRVDTTVASGNPQTSTDIGSDL